MFIVPSEIKILRREYFNRWYSLNAYFFATTFSSFPSMVSETNKYTYLKKKTRKDDLPTYCHFVRFRFYLDRYSL